MNKKIEQYQPNMTQEKLEKNLQTLNDLEFQLKDTFEDSHLRIEERKQLKDMEKDIHNIYRKYAGELKNFHNNK